MKRYPFVCLLISSLGAAAAPISADNSPAASQAQVSATPGSAAAVLSQNLKAAGGNAAAVVVPQTVAAIQGLGAGASSKQISAIVYAAVRAVPDSALNIVRAAVKISPEAAPDIAAAAARAVPNPWKEVRYQRGGDSQKPPQMPPQASAQLPPQPAGPKERDFKSDFKSPVDDALLQPVEEVFDPADPGTPMSLAEAIVQTAVESGGNLGDVQGAVDGALFGDPGLLFTRVGGVRGISGVGDAGTSNYANEPHNPGDPGDPGNKKKLAAPRTPNQQPVSR